MSYLRKEMTYQGDLDRFRVVDDTPSTWAILDKDTNLLIHTGLQRFQADELCEELNEQEREAEAELEEGEEVEDGEILGGEEIG